MSPRWAMDSLDVPTESGPRPSGFHDFILEPSGAATLSGFFHSPPLLRANTQNPVSAPLGTARRCVLWNQQVVCADYPASPNGRVTAMDPATGQASWTFDIRVGKPEFVSETSAIFLARLVVQGNDRLAALYEAYPKGVTDPNVAQCRSYYLVVLDAAGEMVMGQRVSEALLSQCNHPHPYGVASDALGNLYIAFSPTRSPTAPLVPDAPTLLMSYSRDGLFRWKRLDETMRGGELAVARGLLYPENSAVVLSAAHGVPAFSIPRELGRAVVARSTMVPEPMVGSSVLEGYEAGDARKRWVHRLSNGWTFWSDQVRLARWETSQGPRTVALTFVAADTLLLPHYNLYGIDVTTGAQAFDCPLSPSIGEPRTPPQLLEVAEGSLTWMDGAVDAVQRLPSCAKCDPPFAGSSGTFRTVEVPGVSVAKEPWLGTFGGAAHDHQEEILTGTAP